MTDITGYSLLGHGHEMAHLNQADFHVITDNLGWYAGALDYAQQDIFPGGMHRNRDYFSRWVMLPDTLPTWREYLLYDPQTSGGLLIAVHPDTAPILLADLQSAGESAQYIGYVTSGTGKLIIE